PPPGRPAAPGGAAADAARRTRRPGLPRADHLAGRRRSDAAGGAGVLGVRALRAAGAPTPGTAALLRSARYCSGLGREAAFGRTMRGGGRPRPVGRGRVVSEVRVFRT